MPKSVRWRLPLSYAAIALLAALALGLVLLITLRGYYRQQELDYLTSNARAIGGTTSRLFELDVPSSVLQAQLRSIAFLSQTRVRLLDPELQVMADSGSPQEQQGVVSVALESEMLDIQDAAVIPEAPADVGGLFLRQEGDRLFVGTGSLSGVKVNDEWEVRHDGPVVEVVTTHDTLVYRDNTLQQLGNEVPTEPIQQVLKPGSVDEIGEDSTVRAWGKRRDDELVAELVVFVPRWRDDASSAGYPFPEASVSVVPDLVVRQTVEFQVQRVIELVEPESDAGGAESGGNQSVRMVESYSINATPYGFGLNVEAPLEGPRSDQVIRQVFRDHEGKLLGYVELSEGPAYGRQILVSVTRGWALAGVVAVLLAATAGWMASRGITTPLLALTGVTTQMAAGDLSARADVGREDEFGVLASSFNEMAGQVQNTVISLRRFVSNAAHELHTPLTALHTNLELMVDEEDVSQRRDLVTRAQTQVERLEALTQALLDLSRLESGAVQDRMASVELTALVREASEPYASQAEQAGLTFGLTLPEAPVTVEGDGAQLQRALSNLLDNAVKFTPEGGSVRLGLRCEDGSAELWVEDTGIGIPEVDLPHLFGRFHRGRNASAYPGSGLGLAIVKAIVENHGGCLAVESKVGQGSRFSLALLREL